MQSTTSTWCEVVTRRDPSHLHRSSIRKPAGGNTALVKKYIPHIWVVFSSAKEEREQQAEVELLTSITPVPRPTKLMSSASRLAAVRFLRSVQKCGNTESRQALGTYIAAGTQNHNRSTNRAHRRVEKGCMRVNKITTANNKQKPVRSQIGLLALVQHTPSKNHNHIPERSADTLATRNASNIHYTQETDAVLLIAQPLILPTICSPSPRPSK